MHLIIAPTAGLGAPRSPVPNSASITRSACFKVALNSARSASSTIDSACPPESSKRCKCSAASPSTAARCAAKNTLVGTMASRSKRAIANPSPPLLPLPQITIMASPSSPSQRASMASKTPRPARSINSAPEIPVSLMVRRSISAISRPPTSLT